MPDASVEQLSVLSALANLERLRIAVAMGDQPCTVRDLADTTGLAVDVVGKHLQILGQAGLLDTHREGHERRYLLRIQRLAEIQSEIGLEPTRFAEFDGRRLPSPVAQRFFSGDRLTSFPSQHAKQIEVLRYLIDDFEPSRDYPETEVNKVLARRNPDVATLRRAFIDEGFMTRVSGVYRRI